MYSAKHYLEVSIKSSEFTIMSRVGMYVQRYHVDGYESQSESCERCVTRNGKTLHERCPWHWWRHAKLALFKTITLEIYAALSLFTINMITRNKIRDIDGNNFDLFNMIQRWFLYRCNFDVSKWHCYCIVLVCQSLLNQIIDLIKC